ncbi:uncharacterized protein LOC107266197 isoform X2 [Cephus cinctus]|nr:uncharacterized protein LOC107266197 isoform X2 [Cephus cinctus]
MRNHYSHIDSCTSGAISTMDFRRDIFDVETSSGKILTIPAVRKCQMRKIKGCDSALYSAVRPVVYIVRVFGLAPYEFVEDRLTPSTVYLIWSLFNFIFYTWVLIVFINRFQGDESLKPLLGYTEFVKVIINYAVAMLDMLFAAVARQEFTTVWNSIQNYDETVRSLGFPRNEKKTTLFVWVMLLWSTVVWTLVSQMGQYSLCEDWLQNITYMLMYVGTSAAVVKFSGMVLLVGQRFDHLNNVARSNDPGNFTTLVKRRTSSRIDVRTIQRLHNDLMNVSESLSSQFSWSLLLWLANLSSHIVINLFFIMNWIINNRKYMHWSNMCLLSAWTVAYISQIFLLSLACDIAIRGATDTGSILMNWWRGLDARHYSIESTLHLVNRKLVFSAAGCFGVNLRLLRSIAAFLTTYL